MNEFTYVSIDDAMADMLARAEALRQLHKLPAAMEAAEANVATAVTHARKPSLIVIPLIRPD